MKLNKLLTLTVATATTFALAACANSGVSSTSSASIKESESSIASSEESVSSQESSNALSSVEQSSTYEAVTINTYDASGNAITQTFNQMPTKIICNNLSSAKTLIDLGLEEYIIGMPNTDNEVTDSYKDKVASITKLGDKKTISKEVIIEKEPDLIVGRAQMFSSTSFGTYDELNSYSINVYAQAASVKTATLDSVLTDIDNLGKIFKVEEKAAALENELKKEIDEFSVTSGATLKNALVMCNFNGSTFGAYKSTLQEKGLNTLGYTNVATGTSGLSLENLVTMNPEVIIYVTSDRNAANDANAVDTLKATEAISDVPAIKNNKIVTLGYDEFMEYGSNIVSALKKVYAAIM